jgi:hypothetical protein
MKITTLDITRRYPVDLVETARGLLRHLPPEHYAGISRITLSGGAPLDERAEEEILGQYFEAYEGEPAFIMLYPEEMAREVPKFLRPFPLVWRVLLAETLYHEVGHHYQRFTHGIRKPVQEDHAEGYGKRYARSRYPGVYRMLQGWKWLHHRTNRVRARWIEVRRRRGRVSAADLYELGRIYWEDRKWFQVVSAWEEALERDPQYTEAREWLPRARRLLHAEARRRAARSGRRKAARRRGRGRKRP